MGGKNSRGGYFSGRKKALGLLGIFILFSLSACGRPGGPKLPRNALTVPIVRQYSSYSCGTAAALSVLYYWRVYEGNENALLKIAGTTPAEGTAPQGIVKVARHYGLTAGFREMVTIRELRAALGRGETVILDIQAWPDNPGEMPWSKRREDGHYVVLTALDDKHAYFMDPSEGSAYTYIPLAELVERWHDYENTPSGVWNNRQLAIFISGKTPLKKYPGPLVPTE